MLKAIVFAKTKFIVTEFKFNLILTFTLMSQHKILREHKPKKSGRNLRENVSSHKLVKCSFSHFAEKNSKQNKTSIFQQQHQQQQ